MFQVERNHHQLLGRQTNENRQSQFYGGQSNNGDEYQCQIIMASSLDQQFHLLKRVNLKIDHLPEVKISGGLGQTIEFYTKIYGVGFSQFIQQLSLQQKISSSLEIIKTYQLLVKQYGLFLVHPQHIRVDRSNKFALWIHDHYSLNHCSHPLEITDENIEFVVCHFVKFLTKYISPSIFKHRIFPTFDELSRYLEFVSKRNKIHRKCKHLARQHSSTQKRTSHSLKNMKYLDLFSKSNSRLSVVTPTTPNLQKADSNQKQNFQQYLNISISGICHQRGSNDEKRFREEAETTIFSRRNNMSYMQLSNLIQKKSCVFGSNPEILNEQLFNRSTQLDTKKRSSQMITINTRFCPIQYKRKQAQNAKQKNKEEASKSKIEKKNSVEMSLNCLFLSQINEDPENEIGGSDLKKRHHLKDIIEEFSNFLIQ